MSGYADELSLKLTARDEMSQKLRETRKQLSGLERDMAKARKEVSDTGSPEAVRELKRLEAAWEDAAQEQAKAAKGLKDARQAMEALKEQAGKTAEAVEDVGQKSARADDRVRKVGRTADRTSGVMGRMAHSMAKAAAKVTHLDRRLDAAEKSMGKASGRWGKVGVAAAAGAGTIAAGVAVGAAAATRLAGDAIGAGSDLNESLNKATTIFGKNTDAVVKYSKTAADGLGMTQQAAIDASSQFALFGKAAGIGGGKLGKFSTDLTTLSADFASFYNTSPADAINAISSAMQGQSEPIRRFGILMDANSVAATALDMGLVEANVNLEAVRKGNEGATKAQADYNKAVSVYGKESREAADAQAMIDIAQQKLAKALKGTNPALTTQQKTLATQRLIMKQSKVAQGDFAKTSDGLANSQRRLKAQLSDVTAQVGLALLPAATKFMGLLLNRIIPAVRETAAKVLPKLREGFKVVTDAIEENRPGLKRIGILMGAVGKVLIEKVIPALAKVQFKAWASGIKVLGTIGDAIMDAAPGFIEFNRVAVGAFRGVLDTAMIVMEGILKTAERTMGWIPGIGDDIKKASAGFTSMRETANKQLDKVEKGLGKARDAVEAWNRKARKAEAAKLRGDLKDLESKLKTAHKKLSDPNLTKPEASKIRANIKDLESKAKDAKAALKKIPDEHVTTLKLRDPSGMKGVAKNLSAMNGDTIHVKFDGIGGGGFSGGADARVTGGSAGYTRPANGPSSGSWARYRSGKWHGGADIGARAGSAVRASSTQQVKRVLFLNRSYGHHAVTTNGRYDFVYAHMNKVFAHPGQVIRRGGLIGTVGNTGNSDGAHLHYEVRPAGRGNGSAINPYRFMAQGGRVRGPGTGTSDEVPIMGSNGEFMLRARSARRLGYARLDHMNRTGRFPALPPIVSAPNVTVQAPGGQAPLVGQMIVHPATQLDFELGLAREARRQAREAARFAHARPGA